MLSKIFFMKKRISYKILEIMQKKIMSFQNFQNILGFDQ